MGQTEHLEREVRMSTAVRVFADRLWLPAEIGEAIGDDEFWRRYEIVDGVLVVSPPPAQAHDVAITALAATLRAAVPDGWVATIGVGIDLGRSYRVTDATVVTRAYAQGPPDLAAPGDVLIAVEVESPSSVTTDRVTKPAQYAAVGIPHYWRVELDPLRLNVYRLVGRVFELSGSWGANEAVHVTDPFEVRFDLSELMP